MKKGMAPVHTSCPCPGVEGDSHSFGTAALQDTPRSSFEKWVFDLGL